MIIDTHFHAFPGKYLELIPEAQNDVRGVGFHAFNHREYLDVMDRYGIEVGSFPTPGAGSSTAAIRPGLWNYAGYSTTRLPMRMRSTRGDSKPSPGCP